MTEHALVTVAVVGSRTEADLVAGLLSSYGLTATLSTDDSGGQNPQIDLQGVRVLVPMSEEADARRILADVEKNNAGTSDD